MFSRRRLILRSFQSPGDVVMLTAAVRDLHAAHPGQFVTDIRTSADDLWLHNPHITRLQERESGVQVLEMHYPLIHHSNQRALTAVVLAEKIAESRCEIGGVSASSFLAA